MSLPSIKVLGDFEDSVHYCFYLLGYAEGTRGIGTIQPKEGYEEAYQMGIHDAEIWIDYLFLTALLNDN